MYVSSYYCICVLIPVAALLQLCCRSVAAVSSYCCICVRMLLYYCICVLIPVAAVLQLCCSCVAALCLHAARVCVRIVVGARRRCLAAICVCAYTVVTELQHILLYMCATHTTIHTTIYVCNTYYYMCVRIYSSNRAVRILLYVCPHTTTCVSAY
jgi:hypothetical protein